MQMMGLFRQFLEGLYLSRTLTAWPMFAELRKLFKNLCSATLTHALSLRAQCLGA